MAWIYKRIIRLWANTAKSYIQIEGSADWREFIPPTDDMYKIAAHSFFNGKNAWIDLRDDGRVYQMST